MRPQCDFLNLFWADMSHTVRNCLFGGSLRTGTRPENEQRPSNLYIQGKNMGLILLFWVRSCEIRTSFLEPGSRGADLRPVPTCYKRGARRPAPTGYRGESSAYVIAQGEGFRRARLIGRGRPRGTPRALGRAISASRPAVASAGWFRRSSSTPANLVTVSKGRLHQCPLLHGPF